MTKVIVGLLFFLSLGVQQVGAATTIDENMPSEAASQIDDFLRSLEKGNTEEAVTRVIQSSPLWSSRTGVKEQLLAQIEAGLKIYGPVSAHECIAPERVGTMVIRQYCFAQHRDMVTRWEFDVARTSTGWKMAYFGFTDQIQSWF